MRQPPALALALVLLLPSAGCEFLPAGPLAELEEPPPLPQPETTWLDLGRQLLAADRPDEAQDAFIRSLRVEGVTAAALTGAGVAAERQGMLTEARRHFEAARLRAPHSVVAHDNLGAVLYRMGELRAARRAFELALELSGGTDEVARRNLPVVEAAIRRADVASAAGPPMDREALRVERRGPTRYRLIGTAEAEGNG